MTGDKHLWNFLPLCARTPNHAFDPARGSRQMVAPPGSPKPRLEPVSGPRAPRGGPPLPADGRRSVRGASGWLVDRLAIRLRPADARPRRVGRGGPRDSIGPA